MAIRSRTHVLAYDIGGTKIAAGVVDARGKVIAELKEFTIKSRTPDALIEQAIEMGRTLLKLYPQVKSVGVASAGPLHAGDGELLNPVNLSAPRPKKSWHRVPIARELKRALNLPVTLNNDAAAAILAERWQGAARGSENAVILTLGTGLGVGVIANGELVRAGRGMHPEGGHLTLNAMDETAVCGCGNVGCAEAYLSGNGFSRHFQVRYARPSQRRKLIHSAEIAKLARGGNAAALRAFDEYATLLATAIHNYVVLYAPEVVILTGSFAAASDLFLKKTQPRLKKLLSSRRDGVDFLPKVILSTLDNHAGLLGGAYLALEKLGQIRR